MKKGSNALKILLFNLAFAFACIFLFSPGLFDLYAKGAAVFYIVLAAAVVLFLVVNYVLLAGPPKKVKLVDTNELKAPKDYIKGLTDLLYKKEFENAISVLVGQVKRVTPKQAALSVILEQNFEKTEMTYIKFKTTIDEVVGLFFDNTKKAMNRISVFDETEYRKLMKNELNLPEDSRRLKVEIYQEHLRYVQEIVRRNEQIITLLDNLTLEISKLDDINHQSMENSVILQEMKELIQNTKYYA